MMWGGEGVVNCREGIKWVGRGVVYYFRGTRGLREKGCKREGGRSVKVTHGTTYDAVQIQVFDLRNSFCH